MNSLADSDTKSFHDAVADQKSGARPIAELGSPQAEHILQFFASDHLPERLQAVSRPFGLLALELLNKLPRNPERTVALRKLLESKDAAVRALIAKSE